MRAGARAAAALAFIFICLAGGLVGGLAVGSLWIAKEMATTGLVRAAAIVAGVLLVAFAFWLQIQLMKVARTLIGRLEQGFARKDVIAYEDVRAPFVLFLRAFADDDLASFRSPRGILPMLSKNRLETWVVDALKPIARAIAVGKPGEDLPQTGAARLYLHDDAWMERVASLMERASAVVIFVGESGGVWWEIERALQSPQPDRIAFVLPLGRRDGAIGHGFYPREGPPRPVVQQRLAEKLREMGFGPMPPRGTHDFVLVFDRTRRPRFLRTKMTFTFFVLWLNPVTWLLTIATWLIPAIPWRLSWAGEVSYVRTLAPFVRGLRPAAAR